MLKSLYGLICIAAVAGCSLWAHAESAEDLSVVVLFDRSASMAKDMGRSTRIDLARDAFNNWSSTLAGRSNVAVRFFAGGVDKNNIVTNCEASELVIPFGRAINTADIASLSAGVRAIGRKTNIAYALEQARNDLAGRGDGKILLISDGLENCERDPISVAKELGDMDIDVDVLALGEPQDVAGLGKIALASGGTFSIATSADQLAEQMQQQLPDFDFSDMPVKSGVVDDASSAMVAVVDAPGAPPAKMAPAIEPLVLESIEVSEDQPGRVAIELILDASGSMWGRIGGKTKIAIARDALNETLSGLDDPVFWVGLRAYGFDDSLPKTEEASCPNTELLSDISASNLRNIRHVAYGLTPYGYTPITESLSLAGDDLASIEADSRMIILITDGKETCGGDPVATAEKLCKQGIGLETHIVGFDLEPDVVEQMRRVAKAGCGTYSNADDAKELTQALHTIVESAQDKINPTWLRTIYPTEGGSSRDEAIPLVSGTYTLKRSLAKGEQMYFRVNTEQAQHGVLRGLIQAARLVRKDDTMTESTFGRAQFALTIYTPDDKKGRGRKMRLSGEPGTYKHIGYLDTYGDGFVFSIGSDYDTVHKDSLFNVNIREAGDRYEGVDAPRKDDLAQPVELPSGHGVTGHLGEGDFEDTYRLPMTVGRGTVQMHDEEYPFGIAIYSVDGERLWRQRAIGQMNFEIPAGAAGGELVVEDKNPSLKQVFTGYEILLSPP